MVFLPLALLPLTGSMKCSSNSSTTSGVSCGTVAKYVLSTGGNWHECLSFFLKCGLIFPSSYQHSSLVTTYTFPLHNRSSKIILLRTIVWIRSPKGLGSITYLGMTILVWIPTGLMFYWFEKLQQFFINYRCPCTIFTLLLCVSLLLIQCFTFCLTQRKQAFFNSKRLTNFVSDVERFVPRHLAWWRVHVVRDLLGSLCTWGHVIFLKCSIITYVGTPISSSWLYS